MNNILFNHFGSFADFRNPIRGWGNFRNKQNFRILVIGLLLLGVLMFPISAIQGFFAPTIKITPNNALDPVEIERLMNSLNVAGQTCINPIPLRCEGPINWFKGG